MVITFMRYVLKTFFWHFMLLWISFTALLQLFDLLNNADDILRENGGGFHQLLLYAGLRVPEIASFLSPFCVLLGTLLSLGKLERNNEILAFKATGAPYYLVLVSFLPAVALVGILNFVMSDQIVPSSVAKLISLNLYPDKKSKTTDGNLNNIWIQDGQTVVEAKYVDRQGTPLHQVWLYRRDQSGNIQTILHAETASFQHKQKAWALIHVLQTDISSEHGAITKPVPDQMWSTKLTPAEFSSLVEVPQAMSLKKIWRFINNDQIGVRPSYFYETWLQKRIALPISSILMILLAAPVAQSLQRRDRSLAGGIAIGFGLGFLYFITDGLILSLGETGAIPPFFAAWLPPLLFASMGGIMLIRLEGY